MVWGRPVDSYWDSKRSKTWFKKWLNRYQTGQKNWYKDLPGGPSVIHNKTEGKIELVFDKIRKSLMDGTEESTRYSFAGDI